MHHGSHVEIEHKFVVDAAFDRNRHIETARDARPLKELRISGTDTYFRLRECPRAILRYRADNVRRQLTVKSLEVDPEIRREVNLTLEDHPDIAEAQVRAFLDTLGTVTWTQKLYKDVHVFEFPDCEWTYYDAKVDGGTTISCVEFEALGTDDLARARQILHKYEAIAGFDGTQRTQKSLLELAFGASFDGC